MTRQNPVQISLKKPATRVRSNRWMGHMSSMFLLLLALGILAPAAHAEPAFVLLTAADGAPGGRTLAQQLANWRQLGMVADAQLIDSNKGEPGDFDLLGILEFPDELALQRWQEIAQGEVGEGVSVTVADALSHAEKTPRNSLDSIFQVMQYDVLVPREEFIRYLANYQTPELAARIDAGIMNRFTNYYARPGSNAPWQSLLVLEYRDSHSFAIKDEVKAEIAARLKAENPVFRETNDAKHGLRVKTAETQSVWVELPPPALDE